jgi:hypothetical protein
MEAFSPLRFTSNAAIRLQRGPCGPVAQWLEQGTHNPLVGGSNPSRPTFPQEEVSLRKGVVSGAVGGYGSELLRIDQGNLLRCWGRWRIRDDALALQDLEYVLEYGLVMLLDHDVFGLLFEGVKILKVFLKLKG